MASELFLLFKGQRKSDEKCKNLEQTFKIQKPVPENQTLKTQ